MTRLSRYRVLGFGVISPLAALFLYALATRHSPGRVAISKRTGFSGSPCQRSR